MEKGEKQKQELLYPVKKLSGENVERKALYLHADRPYGEEDLRRIREMESIYDRAVELRKHPEQEEYRTLLPDIERLKHYYESGQWQTDYEADEAGLIPSDLKRGILSQDALYDFFSEE